jgi:uncharacterized glyoxalase superfamily protein PhnB
LEEIMAVKPIPDGYHSVTPMLITDRASSLIDFMKQAFGAEQRMLMPGAEEGSVAHAELTIGGSALMVSDATPQYPPNQNGIHLYVEDVDAVFQKAVAAGATAVMAPADQFYGDRSATVRDGHGNLWSIATHIEDVSDEEMARRMANMGA